MRQSVPAAVAAIVFLTPCCIALAAPDKVALAYRAKVGQVAHYLHTGTMSVEFDGEKHVIDLKQTASITVKEVQASGDIVADHTTESEEETFDGQKAPSQDDGDKTTLTITIHPDGTLAAFKSSDPKDQDDKTDSEVRMFAASKPVYTSQPIAVGDKWSHEFQADSDMGTRAAKADYEVLGFEKSGGADAVKLRVNYAETQSGGLSTTGVVWVEKSSGDTLASDLDYTNIPMSEDGPNPSGKIHGERSDGSMLGDVAGAAPAQAGTAKAGKASAGDTKTAASDKKDEKKDKTIDETVKDYEKIPGLFTFYRKKDSGRETIYMEIKESQLDKPMLMEVTASTGTAEQIVAGDPINDLLFKLCRVDDDKVMLCTPNINFRAQANTPMGRAVRRSFADGYLEQYKIEARQPDRKSLLINVSELFKGDVAHISEALSGGGLSFLFGGRGGFAMDREKTYIRSIKSFPENVVVETQYHFIHSGSGFSSTLADPHSAPICVDYTIFPLNEDGYRPRLADSRIGYFYTEYQDFNDDAKDDPLVRYIYRWNIEKADPKAAMSAPKKPIVFWLDNAIPVEYRDAVRDGLLYWSKAFAKVGIKDAIVVKQMPDNADWDYADMRYNTIRWVASPVGGYAVSYMRINPITGEIINGDITVDAGLVHFTKLERTHLVDPAAYFADATPPKPGTSMQRVDCDMADGARQQAWFGQLALTMLQPLGIKLDERAYTNAFIKDVVSHEMGHILGLRHNFLASTYHSLDDLKDENKIQTEGISASVMDYNPFNISAIKLKGVDYWTPTIGPYDVWAIQYGYQPIAAKNPDGERYELNRIASQCNQPGLAYESDGVADQFDPDVVRFDMGRDPLAYWTRMLDLSRYMMLHLGDRLPKPGDDYDKFTSDFYMLLGQYTRAAAVASRYIGGLHMNHNHRGDPGEKPVLAPVPAADQWKALNLLNLYVFSPGAFNFPRSYYTKLTDIPWDMESLGAADYPVLDEIAGIQSAALHRVFNPSVLDRVENNEFKLGESRAGFTLAALFSAVSANVWSELETHSDVGALRRQLQRSYLNTMIGMVTNPAGPAPDDAKMLAWEQLRELKHKIQAAERVGSYDTYTKIHLAQSEMEIDRALDARLTIGGAPQRGGSLLDMLLGGDRKSGEPSSQRPLGPMN